MSNQTNAKPADKAPTTEQTTVPTTVANPDRTIGLRFYENAKAATNSRAPIAFAMLDLPGIFEGTTIMASLWARRDTRGQVQSIDVTMPADRFNGDYWRPKPVFVKDAEGTLHPVDRSMDAKGAAFFTNLSPRILEAFYAWQKDPKVPTSVTL